MQPPEPCRQPRVALLQIRGPPSDIASIKEQVTGFDSRLGAMETLVTRFCFQQQGIMQPPAATIPAPLSSPHVAAIANYVATRPGQHEVPLRSGRGKYLQDAKEPILAAPPQQRVSVPAPRPQDEVSKHSRALPAPVTAPAPTAAPASSPSPANALIPSADSPHNEKWKFIWVNQFDIVSRSDSPVKKPAASTFMLLSQRGASTTPISSRGAARQFRSSQPSPNSLKTSRRWVSSKFSPTDKIKMSPPLSKQESNNNSNFSRAVYTRKREGSSYMARLFF